MENSAGVFVGIGQAVAETEKALRLKMVQREGITWLDRWVPKSAIHADSEVLDIWDSGRVVLCSWFLDGRDEPRERRILPMKPPSKQWLRDQKKRMEEAKKRRAIG